MREPDTEATMLTAVPGPWPRAFYRSAQEFWQNSEGLHHAYTIYRTLRGDYKRTFQPDGVFYVGRSPTAYFKRSRSGDLPEHQIANWQRFLWNQSVVPMLVIKSRTRVRVYTAYTRPREGRTGERIEPILDEVAHVLELEKLWAAIEAGTIYAEKPKAFERSCAVDQYLLDNLNAAAHLLAETQQGGVNERNLEFAHHFLTRLMFVCYLIERGMIRGKHFEDDLLRRLRPASNTEDGYFLRHLFDDAGTCARRRDALWRLFAYVKRTFNGSLFPEGGLGKEKHRYSDAFIQVIYRFLQGHNLASGQLRLGFWAYDFAVIPIQTISAVYEGFLGAQGKIRELSGQADDRRTVGSYYTPLHLAELVADVVLQDVAKPLDQLTVLDPACGSGVFLVTLFARMAEYVRRRQNHVQDCLRIQWARTLLELLRQLCGIDISPTACNITCFSLYLALLDQLSPMDVEYLHRHGHKLPPLLADGSADSWNTIHATNFFKPALQLPPRGFDLLIGNPPWVSRGNQRDTLFQRWCEENPSACAPARQIAHGFLGKACAHLSKDGIACLLVPASVLLNGGTNSFQHRWLRSVSVERVVNFSDLRFVLFSGPVHPCMAIRFRRLLSQSDAVVVYEAPKADHRSQQGGPVYIREEDTSHIPLRQLVAAAGMKQAHIIWKRHIWGSWRDERLLTRLSAMPRLLRLAGEPGGTKVWMEGQGCQPYTNTDAKKERKVYLPWWDDSMKFLPGRADVTLAVTPADLSDIPNKFNRLRRSPDRRLFEGARVLLAKASRKAIFCSTTALFSDTFMAIKGREDDDDTLRFLTAVLGSDMAFYFLFHTNSNTGIYRPQVYPKEFLSIPFFLPEEAPDSQMARKLIDEAADAVRAFEARFADGARLGRWEEARRMREEVLEPLVHKYYGINEHEAMLIEDTIRLAARSCTPQQNVTDIPTLAPADVTDCQLYGDTLRGMLNCFGSGSRFKVGAEILRGHPYSIVHVMLSKGGNDHVPVVNASARLMSTFKRMEPLLGETDDRFIFCQSLKVFDGEHLYILKPMQMRFWSRTRALNDADEIAGSILLSKEGG